jgi:hypothetical protein
MVLFAAKDTWEYDGNAWTNRASTGPQIRTGQGMAYDSGRGVTVLFGGDNGTTYFDDTWEWDGNAWTMRATGGPSGRTMLAMAYDRARGVTVLFGGGTPSAGDNNETWEWNGNSWTLRSTTGPLDRRGAALAYDSARGVTVLFGGETAGGPAGDTWEWDGATWTERANSGPIARFLPAMSYDDLRGMTVMFGGYYLYNDTWAWDGQSWTKLGDTGPSPRYGHAMAFDTARGVQVLYGGRVAGGGYVGDTWEWNGTLSTNYGSGWAGTNGIPSLDTLVGPVLCTTIYVFLGNSLGADTTALLLIGATAADYPTPYDGHLLTNPATMARLLVPAGGLAILSPLPCDSALCGFSVYLQALEMDPGATEGVSFTPGLRLTFGT